MKKIIKAFILLILLFGLFLILNTGFSFGSLPLLSETFIFTVVALLLIFYPFLKNIFVLLSLVLLVLMVTFIVLDNTHIANFFGSVGFGIILISSIFYLNQLFKYGHIKE